MDTHTQVGIHAHFLTSAVCTNVCEGASRKGRQRKVVITHIFEKLRVLGKPLRCRHLTDGNKNIVKGYVNLARVRTKMNLIKI